MKTKTITGCNVTQIIMKSGSQYYDSGYHGEGININPNQSIITVCDSAPHWQHPSQVSNREVDITFTLSNSSTCSKTITGTCEYVDIIPPNDGNTEQDRKIRFQDDNFKFNSIIEDFSCIPNPANNETTIHFKLNKTSIIRISVHNSLGENIAILNDGIINKGEKALNFNTFNLPNGVYFVKLIVGSEIWTQSLSIVK